MFKIGDKVKYVGDYDDYSPTEDVTLNKVYLIEGEDEDGDMYFIDDVGERNFGAGPEEFGCCGIFEKVN